MLLSLLGELRPSDREVGAQARTLARLLRLELPLPPGIVLRQSAWLAYLEAYAAQPLWAAFSAQPDAAHAAPLRTLLATQPLPPTLVAALLEALQRAVEPVALSTLPRLAESEALYAVRPAFDGERGAGPRFGGLFNSRLGVAAGALEAALRDVWASAFSDQALAAYREAGLVSTLSVLVQAIPPLDCAGVVWSAAPDDAEALLIEAVWGLAEPLVLGELRPDRWLVARRRGRLLRHEPGERTQATWPTSGGTLTRPLEPTAPAPLTEDRLDDLRRLALLVERVLGGPQAIEWVHDGQRFWIVQCSPARVALRRKALAYFST